MPSQTTNYGLVKPNEDEFYDVKVQNGNMDIIDRQMKSNADGLEKIGELTDLQTTNKSTLVSAINEVFQAGNSVKSDVVTALLSINPSLPITTESTWGEIEAAILEVQTGVDTSDATATATQILSEATAYVKGNKVTGTMPNRGAMTITPNQSNQAIPSGFHNGSGIVQAVTFDASKVLAGTTIAGKGGTMSNKSGQNLTIAYYDQIASLIPHPQDPVGQGLLTVNNGTNQVGYIDGSTKFNMNIANLVPKNIVEGVKVGKINGVGDEVMVGTATVESMGGRRTVSGSTLVSDNTTSFKDVVTNSTISYNARTITVSGLTFLPKNIIMSSGDITCVWSEYTSGNWVRYRMTSLNGTPTFYAVEIVSPFYVTASGFSLPVVASQGTTLNWIAIG